MNCNCTTVIVIIDGIYINPDLIVNDRDIMVNPGGNYVENDTALGNLVIFV